MLLGVLVLVDQVMSHEPGLALHKCSLIMRGKRKERKGQIYAGRQGLWEALDSPKASRHCTTPLLSKTVLSYGLTVLSHGLACHMLQEK